jgi:hypothetical protein
MIRKTLWGMLAVLCLTPLTFSQAPGERQYYSEWKKHTAKNYYYRSYFYKKEASDKEYVYHYGIYYPSRGQRVYMYNPQSRKFWGAWDGKKYSLLAKEKQKASLDDIAASDFPAPGDAPPIPGVADRAVMIAPPNDFPKLDDDRP